MVVRHRLRHNGDVLQLIKGTSIRRCNCQKIYSVYYKLIIQRLRLQSVRSHADAKLSMHCLDLVVVVVLSICRHFAIFVSIYGRAKLPTVKFQQILWFPSYASVFEISWFITNSSPSFPSLFHLLLEGSQLKDSRGLNNLVVIKDLL